MDISLEKMTARYRKCYYILDIQRVCITPYIDVTWASLRLKSPTTPLFVEKDVKANIKASKPRITDPMWGESTGDQYVAR